LKFSELNLHPELLEGISSMNIITATPIQEQAIPPLLEGKDLIGIAQTGTGKTAAFLLPILNMIMDNPDAGYTQALIIVPTRELALQIDQAVEAYSYFTGASSMAIYGGGDGMDFSQEKQAIISGVDIIIATPGRLISHMHGSYADFSKLRFLILDEADRMLDMGFQPDLTRIIRGLNENRQTLMFSATMPVGIANLAKTYMSNPVQINTLFKSTSLFPNLLLELSKVPMLFLRTKSSTSSCIFSKAKNAKIKASSFSARANKR